MDREDATSDRASLIEIAIRDRLERRLWSRLRWTLGLFVLVFGVLAFLGYVSARNAIATATLDAARAHVDDTVQANKPDLAAIRRELREDADYVRERFLGSYAELQAEVRHAGATADRIESAASTLDEEAREVRVLRGGVTLLERTLVSEIDRIKELHERYDTDVSKFTSDAERITVNASTVINEQLATLAVMVERELDEMRLVLTDHAAGTPALFSAWLDLDQGKAVLEGTNFGSDPGRILIRVRLFGGGLNKELLGESDSILVVAKSWSPTTIEIDMGTQLITMITEAKAKVLKNYRPEQTLVRYGILIQAADGRMSHWSGASADITLPGVRAAVAAN